MSLYIRNPLTSIVYSSGEWVIINFQSNKQLAIEDMNEESMHILSKVSTFCNQTKSQKQIIDYMIKLGINAPDARHIFDEFNNLEVIVEYFDNDILNLFEKSSLINREFFEYFSAKDSINHADYSKPDIYKEDAEDMKRFLQESSYPDITKSYLHNLFINLPHPATSTGTESLWELGNLLFWSGGRLRNATFLEVLPVMLKPVPSKGARTPFEFYLSVGENCKLPQGLYHYNVNNHYLSYIGEIKTDISEGNYTLFITAIYDRYQWRYRSGWAYKDLFFELGHVKETINFVARELDIKVCPTYKYTNAFLDEFLYEECLYSIKLKNI
ncbi:TPA: SagB/ThcOx family dehydrogenase [Bacillus paranthracis]|uniref:SagB/ThcOx family dehydrogenase n=1 Tax=Bacillus cereus group sp. MYBK101-2 TaxID=3450700 RepID=UPI0032FCD9A4|nr:SagB/ThcOx family dehydrogenase [Bacillus paranthracis]